MKRREFLKASVTGAAALALGARAALAQEKAMTHEADVTLAPPCGLYCGICGARASYDCHGCGCDCGMCAGQGHATSCKIARCAAERKVDSCADCKEFACTRLIQFCYDPIWRTHAPVIENLRRRKTVGTKAWLAEQEEFWKDEKHREGWMALGRECSERNRQATKK